MSNQEFKKRILFVGIPDMAYVCLDGLIFAGYNIVGVLGPKKNHATYLNFKNFVESRKMNFIEYDKLDGEEFINTIRGLNVDIAVVCSFNYKIPQVLLNSVKDGFINVHPSILPDYRGANPYSHVIINGEKFTGVTIHFMDRNFDSGDIIIQQKMPITPKETMGTLFNRLNFMGLELLIKVLADYENGSLEKIKQPEGEFKLGEAISDDKLFINFNKTAVEIEQFVRGLNPFIIASTTFRSTFMKVFCAEVENQNSEIFEVGEIVKIENDKFYISTKEGLLAPTVIQFGSFFIGTAKDFIEMLNIKIGEKFGG